MNPQAMSAALAQIKQSTGLNIIHVGGAWMVVMGNTTVPATATLAAFCDDVLNAAIQNQAAAQASRNGTLPLLRALVPSAYRPILRRSTQAYRAATITQQAGNAPGMLGSIGAGIGVGYGIGTQTGGILGGGFGAIGGAIGGAFGLGGGAIGAGIGATVGKIAGDAVSLVLGAVATASKVAAGGLTLLVGALGLAIKATTQFGQSVLTLAQKTGGGYGQAAGAIFTAKGFGIGASDLSTDPQWMQQARARLYGGDASGSIADIGAFRNRYNQLASRGPGGLMQAQAMAEITGKSAYIGTANLPNDLYNQQASRIQTIGRGFNINPDTLARATQNWSLFMAAITTGLSALGTKVGTEVLPKIMPVLDKAIDWLSSNAGRVSDLIVQGVQTGWDYLKKFAVWLYSYVPPALASASLSVLQFMKSIRDGALSLWDRLGASPIGKALGIGGSGNAGASPGTADASAAPGGNGSPGVPGSGGQGGGAWDTAVGWGKAALRVGAAYLGLRTAVRVLGGPTGYKIGHAVASSPIGRAIGAGALVGASYYEALRHADNPLTWQYLGLAGVVAGKMFYRNAPSTMDIAKHYLGAGVSRSFDAMGIGVPHIGAGGPGTATTATRNGGDQSPDKLDAGIAWVQQWAKNMGKPEDRQKYLEGEMSLLESINRNTAATADAVKGIHQGAPEAIQGLYARAAAYVAEDAYINMNR